MVRHSKNNTNAATFSYDERQALGQGTKRERLGRDAMRNFNACSLCLSKATDPRVCTEGHIYCQECVITNLLTQKKDIKRQTLLLERLRSTEADELASARQAARARVLSEFEATQSGLSSKVTAGKVLTSTKGGGGGGEPEGKKRKFDLDEGEIERLAKEGEEEALQRTALEMAEARKAKLPNFWLPSLTPKAAPAAIAEVKLQTLCTVAHPPHPMSLKSLTVVKFEEDSSDADKSNICPVCRKALNNNVKAFVLKPCGDVICKTCVDTLCTPDKACAHCNTPLATKGPTVIELKREGTGFAAGGQAEAVKFDLPFQG